MKAIKGRIFKRRTKRHGEVWYIDYTVNGKRTRHRLNDDHGQPIKGKDKAQKAADRILHPHRAKDEAQRRKMAVDAYNTSMDEARAADEAARPKTPIADMWERNPWETNRRGSYERRLADTTIRDSECQWSKFVQWSEDNGLSYAEDFTEDHAAKFKTALTEQGLSGDRINKILMCCKVMFELSGIDRAAFDGLRRVHHKPTGRRELTRAELSEVCGAAEGELRTLFAIGLYTGLRLGDACRLKWADVNPDITIINAEPTKSSYKADSEIVLPVHPVLQAILAETPHSDRKGPLMPRLSRQYNHDRSQVSGEIQKHFKSCEVRTQRPGTGKGSKKRAVVEVGFHSLRHSFVSQCARQGVPLHVVQSLCGHSSPQVQRLYLHSSNSDAQKAIAALPAITGEADTDGDMRRELKRMIDALPGDEVERMLGDLKKSGT